MSQAPMKAQLIELDEQMQGPKSGGKVVTVQFNPETLKLQFANQIQTNSSGGGDQSQGSAGRQFIGSGTTKLSVQLWFDASSPGANGETIDDVRKLTQDVTFFITPQAASTDAKKFLPPGIRFLWGSLLFDGLVDSLEEALEYFSPQGKPLRANISLGLSQQKILRSEFKSDAWFGLLGKSPKTIPQIPIHAGQSLQSAAASNGIDWQSLASSNGINNPRFPGAGTMLDPSSLGTGK